MATERGQAGIELVALVPCLLLLVVVLAQGCVLALCAIAAERAASAGARAAARGAPPGAAVRAALPGTLARGARVRVGSRRRGRGHARGAARCCPLPGLSVGASER